MERQILNAMTFVLTLVVGLTAGAADADITSDLVSWWTFNDGSGNTAVDSAGGINGTLKPGQPNGPTWVPGKIDDCLEFDTAKKNCVECGPHPALDITGSLTLAAWVKKIGPWIGNSDPYRYDIIIFKAVSDGSTRAFRLSRNASSDGVCLTINTIGGEVKVRGATAVNDDEWHHIAGVYDMENGRWFIYVDAQEDTATVDGSASGNIQNSTGRPLLIGFDGAADDVRYWGGLIDEVRVYNRALSPEDIKELYESKALATPKGNASSPSPADGATDVPRDVALEWAPGVYAPAINGHKVYFSENFNEVNDGIGGITQSTNSYDPGRLNMDTTYYWRIDEVNGPPDYTVYEGSVWSFTTEPVGYPITNVTATASSSASNQGPASATVDGSGLTGDLHSTDTQTMWASDFGGPQPTWIKFEFNRLYLLHEMWVWNSNTELETTIGYGFKDVTIEYSLDGIDYTTLGTTHEFAQATGMDDYTPNTTIDFGGLQAKYVRLTVNTNWAPFPFPQFGLSEVRFFHIPLRARGPNPDSGATDVNPDVILGWKAGREAVVHNVYVSADPDALTLVGPVAEPAFDTTSLDLELGQDYHWRVDEVNDAETTSTWHGDIWNFTTVEFLVVDDFESYNSAENQIWYAWKDGLGYGTPDEPPYYAGNGTGSAVGDENSPSYMEETIVHGGDKSMPFSYNNTAGTTSSEAELTLTPAQDWTAHGIQTLSLWFYGDPTNLSGQLYVKVNNAKTSFSDSAAAISRPFWTQWNIDLASVGTDLTSVNTLTIGVEGSSGIIYVDDIRLYAKAAELIVPPFIVAVEDAWVREDNPDTNFGAPGAADSDRLRWNSEAGQALALGVRNRSFIKFKVPANVPENVQLVLNRTNGGVPIEIRFAVTNDWDESTITWNNQPAFGDVVVASGNPSGGLNSFDVSEHITGPGTYSFVVVGVADPGENAGTFESKDAGGNNPPILELKPGP